jgi:hypothetical protein
MTRFIAAAALFTGLTTLAGCSSATKPEGGTTPPDSEVLREVGGLISMYSGEFKKGPAKAADLARYEAGYPIGYAAVQSGQVVVQWGVPMILEEGGETAGGTTDVVAYEKKVPTEGGQVLLHNGTVKEMTAAEFAAAPKAGKK